MCCKMALNTPVANKACAGYLLALVSMVSILFKTMLCLILSLSAIRASVYTPPRLRRNRRPNSKLHTLYFLSATHPNTLSPPFVLLPGFCTPAPVLSPSLPLFLLFLPPFLFRLSLGVTALISVVLLRSNTG
jgi:hypothetical protein